MVLLFSLPMSAYPAVQSVYEMMETESKIIKLDSDLQRAMVANSDLANVQVINNRELLVSGQKAGRTDLILWYRNRPNQDVRISLKITPDQSRHEEITEALSSLIQDLDPDGGVEFQLRTAWINPESSVRREVDEVGNQIDGEGNVSLSARQDKDVLQDTESVGQLRVKSLAGNYMVILSGEVSNAAKKKRIHSVISALGLSVVNMIDVTGPKQIRLSVRVAEVTKGNPFRSGFAVRDKRDRYGIFPPGNLGTTASFLLNVDSVASGTQAGLAFPHQDGFQLGFNPRGGNLFGVLSMLEGHNLARVLAKPELIVQSGETASFLVGGEVPIPVAQNDDAITVSFKEYGVRLRFSPIVTEQGEIQMTVEPEISNIDQAGGTQAGNIVIPGFKTRKAATTITVASGQSFVIGGLIQDNFSSNVSKVPFLGDIPVLGALFRSTSYEKDESELAIMVTAKFEDPINADKTVTLPGEDIDRPSSLDGFIFGKVAELLPPGSAMPTSSIKIGLESPL
ncbi:MAG TPA: pilus assembly protein N-terminal domain-containing protein [Thiomicrospira sp.]